jgi:hypothetical protein
VRAEWLFRRTPLGRESPLRGVRLCLRRSVFVNGMRFVNEKGKVELLVVVSDMPAPLSDYALRWPIENLFSGLKSRGFDLEATHLLEGDRLERLFGVLAVAFCWCIATGQALIAKRAELGKLPARKGHGRLAMSEFRQGADLLRRLLAPICGERYQPGYINPIQLLYGT